MIDDNLAICSHCGERYNEYTDICWKCGLGDDDEISVHLVADKNLKPETAAALGEMVRCAVDAIKQGKLGRKHKESEE